MSRCNDKYTFSSQAICTCLSSDCFANGLTHSYTTQLRKSRRDEIYQAALSSPPARTQYLPGHQ